MDAEPLTVTADAHVHHGRWEVRYDAPGVPVPLTAEVRELKDAEVVVTAVVAALAGRPEEDICVEVVLDVDAGRDQPMTSRRAHAPAD